MKHKGFSLAEILITLVILGFVGALGVPMIGQHKLKKPNRIILKHGILECYYDKDGYLHQNRVGNTKLDDEDDLGPGDHKIDGDSCYFKAPTASLFVLQAVGAGGTGAFSEDESLIPFYTSEPFEISGEIRTNEYFHNDINRGAGDSKVSEKDAVPDWVRNPYHWDRQWVDGESIKYIVTSPTAASGKGFCKARRIEDFDKWKLYSCDSYCTIMTAYSCPSQCTDNIGFNGGESGKPGIATFSVDLPVNADVKFILEGTSKTTLEILGLGSATLKQDWLSQGKSANVNKAGLKGSDYNFASNLTLTGNMPSPTEGYGTAQAGGTGCKNEEGLPAIPGSISVEPETIEYRANSLGINAQFGPAGDPGETVMKVMENIPKGVEFRFKPAKNSSEPSYVYIKKKNGEWSEPFITAKSGKNGDLREQKFPIQREEDMPFPRSYYPEKFKKVEPEFIVSGYKSKIARLGFIPGTSGAGAHPFVDHVEGTAGYWLQDVDVVGDADMTTEGWKPPARKCFDGKTLETSYCGEVNTKGKPGAVVMSW